MSLINCFCWCVTSSENFSKGAATQNVWEALGCIVLNAWVWREHHPWQQADQVTRQLSGTVVGKCGFVTLAFKREVCVLHFQRRKVFSFLWESNMKFHYFWVSLEISFLKALTKTLLATLEKFLSTPMLSGMQQFPNLKAKSSFRQITA